jgi:hypothetical protein
LVAGALLPSSAWAGEIVVEVVLAKTEVAVGEPVNMEVRVQVIDDVPGVRNPMFPNLPGVQIISRGSSFSSSYSFRMGRSVSEQTQIFKYRLVPTQAGRHVMNVSVPFAGGQQRPASAPTLVVGGAAAGAPAPAPVPAPGAPPGAPPAAVVDDLPTDASQEIFLWPTVRPKRAYVGQQVDYALDVYERSFGRNSISISSMPSFKDFYTVERQSSQRRRRTTVAGVAYQVHEGVRRALFPQKAGRLEIRGGEITVQQGGGLFFGPRRGGGYKVQGPATVVEVLPLPAKGQPNGFRARNVGRFNISAKVDRSEVDQGEGLTFTVTVQGRGNIELVEPDAWPEIEGLRRFDPDVEAPKISHNANGEIKGTRSWKFLLLADRAGDIQIPAHTLSFFNPFDEKYVTIRTKPITVRVVGTGDPDSTPADVEVGADEGDRFASVMETDRLWHGEPRDPWLSGARWTVAALTAPGLLAASWVARAGWRRYGPDEASRSRARRSAERKRLFELAEAAVASGDGFHPAIAELLQRVALERGGTGVSGLTRDRLGAVLTEEGVPPGEVAALVAILDRCDAARFGAAMNEASERAELLSQARAIVDSKHWRARA